MKMKKGRGLLWLKVVTALAVLALCIGPALSSFTAYADDGAPAAEAPAAEAPAAEAPAAEAPTAEAPAAEAPTAEAPAADAPAAEATATTGEGGATTADAGATTDPVVTEESAGTVAAASIATDKADYAAYESPVITGSGFAPNATVTVTITAPDGSTATITGDTDEQGQFTATYTAGLCDGAFSVTVTDGNTTAATTFTDANNYYVNFKLAGVSLTGVSGSTIVLSYGIDTGGTTPNSITYGQFDGTGNYKLGTGTITATVYYDWANVIDPNLTDGARFSSDTASSHEHSDYAGTGSHKIPTVTGTYHNEYQLNMISNFGTTTPGVGLNNGFDANDPWYDKDSKVTINATAPPAGTGEQYVWNGWTGTGTGTGSFTGTNNPANNKVTMDSPITETASWTHQYYLTVESVYGTTGGEGWYDAGATAAATVDPLIDDDVPGTWYVFTEWSDDATGDTSPSDPITMDGPKTATANWEAQYYVVIYLTQDSWVTWADPDDPFEKDNPTPSQNRGEDKFLCVSYVLEGQTITDIRKAYLMFDLTGEEFIPPDGYALQIDTTALYLHEAGAGHSEPLPLLYLGVNNNWNELTLTWDNQPGKTGEGISGSGTPSMNWFVWSGLSLNQWIQEAAGGYLTVVLAYPNTIDPWHTFKSMNNTNGGPYLAYTSSFVPFVPPPPPPPPGEELAGEEAARATHTPLVLVIDLLGNVVRWPVSANGALLTDVSQTSPDGSLTLDIPRGTIVLNPDGSPAYLNRDPDVIGVLAGTPAPPEGAKIVRAYQLTPNGLTFSGKPATLAATYNPADVPAGTAAVWAFYDEAAGKWVDLETAGYVAGGTEVPNSVATQTSHFTYFAIIAK